MRIIQGKTIKNAPQFVKKKLSPECPLPGNFQIREYGVDTLEAGVRIDRHFHDCDEWWIIVDGKALVEVESEETEVGPGSMIFTPMGELHYLKPLTSMTIVWFEGPLKGEKRSGHLHKDPAEKKYLESILK